MGLGEYISSKSEYNCIKNEMKREKAEIELFPEEEKEEVREIFEKGDEANSDLEHKDKYTWITNTKIELASEKLSDAGPK